MSQSASEISRRPIRPLSPFLANQIAAGEVVERPASIIKELLENALDAGASRIDIQLDRGGLERILVRDDGDGIPAGELPLALAPHATSKISRPDDLAAIESMGFRGEALASIASVSRLELTSRFAGSEEAWSISGRHGEGEEQARPAAHPPGTSVQVEALFFNTPARRRFLRSERTEYRHCEDVVRRVALSHFEVAIHLTHNGRRIYQLPACTSQAERERRLARLCGKAFVDQAVAVDYQAQGLRLRGWVGLPEAARPQSDLQFFFVNERIIRDRLVSHAVREAYADSLYPGRHPAYVLYLEVPAADIDVNVHPTKHEVRFHQGRLVHDFITHSLLQTLVRQGRLDEAPPQVAETAPWYKTPAGRSGRVTDISGLRPVAPPSRDARPAPSRASARPVAAPRPPVARSAPKPAGSAPVLVAGGFAVLERAGALWLVDIPRLCQEQLCRDWQAQLDGQGAVVARPLLIPERLALPAPVGDWLAAHQAGLLGLAGLDLQPAEGGAMLRQIPVGLDRSRFLDWLPALLTDLAEQGGAPQAASLHRQLAAGVAAHPATDWQADEVTAWLGTAGDGHPALRRLDTAALAALFDA